jgi:hypothetical protein
MESYSFLSSSGQNETKNREGRNFPFTARLREIIERQLERTKRWRKRRVELFLGCFTATGGRSRLSGAPG